MRRGFTLTEVAVGVALMGVVSLALSRMTLALVKGAANTVRRSEALSGGRKALLNSGAGRGLLWAAHEAVAVRSLPASALQVTRPGLIDDDYSIASEGLIRSESGVAAVQAAGVSSMTVSYFEMDASGRIVQSTEPAQARLVQVILGFAPRNGHDSGHAIVSAAWLRNK